MPRKRRSNEVDKPSQLSWKASQLHGRNVFRIETEWVPNKDWEQWFLICSDQHWDNPHCLRDMYQRHLDQAVERRAAIIMVGDLFCLMQGKYDPRHAKKDVRPEHDVPHYLDAVIKDCADFHKPYARNMTVVGMGNHEFHILKRHETNPTERFCQALYDSTGHKVYNGLYGGWIQFMFRGKDAKKSQSCTMKYHHGHGGGGIVTKGMIQMQRRQTFVNADIHVSGHIHERNYSDWIREQITSQGVYQKSLQCHLCTGTYKDDYADGALSWEANRGQPPKPQGAWWLRFYTVNLSGAHNQDKEFWRGKGGHYVAYQAISTDGLHVLSDTEA